MELFCLCNLWLNLVPVLLLQKDVCYDVFLCKNVAIHSIIGCVKIYFQPTNNRKQRVIQPQVVAVVFLSRAIMCLCVARVWRLADYSNTSCFAVKAQS